MKAHRTRGLLAVVILVLTAAWGSGCATVICSTAQHVTVRSEPPGATVKVNGRVRGETPLKLSLRRDQPQALRVEREGYAPYEVELFRNFNPWCAGNIMFGAGGLVGILVDNISGAMYSLEPTVVEAEMVPAGAGR